MWGCTWGADKCCEDHPGMSGIIFLLNILQKAETLGIILSKMHCQMLFIYECPK